MYQVGNIYVIAATAVIGGGLFGEGFVDMGRGSTRLTASRRL